MSRALFHLTKQKFCLNLTIGLFESCPFASFNAKYNTFPLVFPLLKCVLSQEQGQVLQMETDQASQPSKAANPSVSIRLCFVVFSFFVPGEHNFSVLMEEEDGYFPQVNLFPHNRKNSPAEWEVAL